jgi:hypothetical protein
MSEIEKYISPFIAQQFPSFYKSEGRNFISFVKAYYEWMEQSNNIIDASRSLLNYADVDLTTDDFIENFRAQYIANLPESAVADKRLLIKHITDLYRSKGSRRAYELLFRLAFNEDIEIYVPNEFIFKPSDNTWSIPRYLEVTSSPFLLQLIGTDIRNSDGTATAIVENYSTRIVQGRTINILELSSVVGEFKNDDKIIPIYLDMYSVDEAPTVRGSLLAVAIKDGGQNYRIGDILDVVGAGTEGKARVATVSNNFSGSVEFLLDNGGSGYTVNAVVTVATTLNLNVAEMLFPIAIGDTVVDATTGANGTVVASNGTFVQLINFSPVLQFVPGNTLQSSGSNTTITRVIGGVGTGASFRVGSIINKESISFISDPIEPYLAVELESSGSNSFSLDVSGVTGTFSFGETVTSSANVVVLESAVVSNTFIQKDESLSNTTLGISGLYVYKADETLIWCTGADSDLTNANLVAGAILVGNTSGSIIQLINTPTKETTTGEGLVETANTTQITLSSVNGYFVTTSTINNSNSVGSATIDSVVRLTDWDFPDSTVPLDNLDSSIFDVTLLFTDVIGTIASLTAINPGSGYLTRPFITVKEPFIITLGEFDVDGTLKGNNAIVDSRIISGNGVITSVEIVNSGFGYLDNESVTLNLSSNEIGVLGSAIVYGTGKGPGRWLNRKSFSSDVDKIQDGLFYQNYSYEIVARRMLESYEKLVRNLVHPAGIALYGRYRSIDYIPSDVDLIAESSIQQQ